MTQEEGGKTLLNLRPCQESDGEGDVGDVYSLAEEQENGSKGGWEGQSLT